MFLNQKGLTQQKLAEIFLSCVEGEQIPTFNELQKVCKVGIGTIQAAIREFRQEGIIELQAQPRYGTILKSRDIGKLWSFLDKQYLTGLFPEPLSLEMQGLSMGLREAFRAIGIPLVIVYGYGSKVRFDRILCENAKEDFVVSSLASAMEKRQENEMLDPVMRFGENSFYAAGSLVVLEKAGTEDAAAETLTVGCDASSYDHLLLTGHAFPKAKLTPVGYGEIPFVSLSGGLDRVVWHRNTTAVFPEKLVVCRPYQDMAVGLDIKPVCEAVLSIDRRQRMLSEVIRHIDPSVVTDIQQKVLRREITPVF